MRLLATRLTIICFVVTLLAGCVAKQVKPQEQTATVETLVVPPIKPEDQPRMKALEEAMQSGDLQLAEGLATELIRDYPNHPALHINLGAIDIRLEQFQAALEHLEIGCRMNSSTPYCPLFEGQALLGLAKYDEAEKAYQRALKLDPNSLYAHYGLGVIYDLYIIDYDKAEEHYDQFLNNAGDDVPATEIKRVTLWKKLLKRKSS